jgi:hypothetical protein
MKDHLGDTIEYSLDGAGRRVIGVVEDYSDKGTEMMIRPRGQGVMQVACGRVFVHQVLPAGTAVAPPVVEPERPPKVRWNPQIKVVLDHEEGKVIEEETNRVRAELGLPVPWDAKIGKKEAKEPPVFLPGSEPKKADGGAIESGSSTSSKE